MSGPRIIVMAFALLLVGGTSWLWLKPEPASTEHIDAADVQKRLDSQDTSLSHSPFATSGSNPQEANRAVSGVDAESNLGIQNLQVADSQAASESAAPTADSFTNLPNVNLSAIGRSFISDTEFAALVERIQSDPHLLTQLIDEFRQETDPQRLAELARLLGEVGGPDVTLTASELIFSGDAQARDLGLELLQQVQPGNSDARDIVTGMLATEVEPEVLVGTLTTLARPGNVDIETRASLSEQVAWLTEHEDASVRAVSLNILSRWSVDATYTSVLIGGLDDSVSTVRESAAYALVGHEDTGPQVTSSLFAVIDNDREEEAVRRGAILALRGMTLTDEQQGHINAIERKLDSRPR